DRIGELAAAASDAEADGLLAVGGGSAIDLAKAVSVETGLPVVSVPTTYSGAEWTPIFGIRDHERRMQGGGGGARLAAIVYEPGPEGGSDSEPPGRASESATPFVTTCRQYREASVQRTVTPETSPTVAPAKDPLVAW